MEEYKVLITTSGLGTRLGILTNFTNKSLLRVGNKPSISYIIENYPKECEFIISIGHYGHHVKQFLKLAYPSINFTFVEIDKYKGYGSSLGYSILKCKDFLNKPFVFHACDTILMDYKPYSLDYNWVIGSDKQNPHQYRTINGNENLIFINEKRESDFNLSYVGVAGIKCYKYFFDILENTVATEDNISDAHVINKMLKFTNFKIHKLDSKNWFDTGNIETLVESREHFHNEDIKILDKKDESIFFFDGFVIKFFHNKQINENRVKRAFKLDGLVPRIIDYTENFYKYEKVEGKLFSRSVNRNKFINFLDWSKDNLWSKKECDFSSFRDKCYEFYVNKTIMRLKEYLNSDVDKEEVINGEVIPSVFDVLKIIDYDWLCSGIPSSFHGDFILDNVIETDSGFVLIDWRQDFAGDLEIGDMYYDLAKLNHNLSINHDIVNRNLFSDNINNCYIMINSSLNECKGVLYSYIKDNGYDLKKVQILTTLIWLNMCPLHEYPFNSFLFKFGKYNLYKNLVKIK